MGFFVLCLLSTFVLCIYGWQKELRPLSTIKDLGEDGSAEFLGVGDERERVDTVLALGEFLLIGTRNTVYNFSLTTLKEQRRISWQPNRDDMDNCRAKMRREEDCQNYIKVLLLKDDNQSLFVCGTNAFKPMCRTYLLSPEVSSRVDGDIVEVVGEEGQTVGYRPTEEQTGMALCPYDRRQNNTALLAGGEFYSATVADMSASDALIFKQPMRTEQYDSQWLNEPHFIKSFAHDDKVYFFFREMAVEHINCGKAIYSRVARVCQNDQGGLRVLRNTWTSFFKARLNCSIPGDFPFYFDEIQSVTDAEFGSFMTQLHRGSGRAETSQIVYAVFNTPQNSIRGSAVCAFSMDDIIRSFEGAFKEQKATSAWLPVRDRDTPRPHPAKACANDSTSIPDQTLNFIKSHPIMDKAVPALGGQPLFVQTSFNYRLTQIAVDWQVNGVDVMFVATDDGRVLKIINVAGVEPVIVEDILVFPDHSPVTKLQLHRHGRLRQLIAVGNTVTTIDLYRCHLHTSCQTCVGLRDPYCSWHEGKCQHSRPGLQSLDDGRHIQCPAANEKSSSIIEPEIERSVVAPSYAQPPTPGNSGAHDLVREECAPCPSCPLSQPPTGAEVKVTRRPLQAQRASTISSSTSHPLDKSTYPGMDNRIDTLAHVSEKGNVRLAASSHQQSSLESDSESDFRLVLAATLPAAVALIVGFILGNLFQHCMHTRQKRHETERQSFLRSRPERVPLRRSSIKEPQLQNPYELTLTRHPHPTSLCSQPPVSRGGVDNGKISSMSPTTPTSDKHSSVMYNSLTRYPPQQQPTSPVTPRQSDGIKWYL